MSHGIVNEAYERLSRTGPEWGEDQLTNHGPMAGDGDALAAAVRAADLIESRN